MAKGKRRVLTLRCRPSRVPFPGLSEEEPESVCQEGGAVGGDDLPACTIALTISLLRRKG